MNVRGDGAIVAHGGVTHGWALYIQNAELCFATTIQGKREVTRTGAKPTGECRVELNYQKNGRVTIRVNGKKVAQSSHGGPLKSQPADGLQVGRDDAGNVGDYSAPFSFEGDVTQVIVEIRS